MDRYYHLTESGTKIISMFSLQFVWCKLTVRIFFSDPASAPVDGCALNRRADLSGQRRIDPLVGEGAKVGL